LGQTFIKKELHPYAGEMNETFDKALEELQTELRIEEASIEIM